MMIEAVRELQKVRRLAAPFTAPWKAIADEVYDITDYPYKFLFRTNDRRLAEYLVGMHNLFHIMAGIVIMAWKLKVDRHRLNKVEVPID